MFSFFVYASNIISFASKRYTELLSHLRTLGSGLHHFTVEREHGMEVTARHHEEQAIQVQVQW